VRIFFEDRGYKKTLDKASFFHTIILIVYIEIIVEIFNSRFDLGFIARSLFDSKKHKEVS